MPLSFLQLLVHAVILCTVQLPEVPMSGHWDLPRSVQHWSQYLVGQLSLLHFLQIWMPVCYRRPGINLADYPPSHPGFYDPHFSTSLRARVFRQSTHAQPKHIDMVACDR